MLQKALPSRLDSTQRPWEEFDTTRVLGVMTVLVGVSQAVVALSFARERSILTFVVGGGGWLLIGIGLNLLRNRDAFETDWTETGTPGWVSVVVLTLLTIAIVAASVVVVLPG